MKLRVFLVRSEFKLKKNQRIGIAVYFMEEAAPRNASISPVKKQPLDYSDTKIEEIYGKPLQRIIYTGQITRAENGERHIEYDINSFTGCAGAVVFLLDKQAPASGVEDQDYGKAIAVHVGRHPGLLDRNFGFILKESMMPDA